MNSLLFEQNRTRFPLLFVVLLAGCSFEPDLSRFEPCDVRGQCAAGFLCLVQAQRCVPVCGENCVVEDASIDAGARDAGSDAGLNAGTQDAGTDAGTEDAGPQLRLPAITLSPAIETKAWSHTFAATGGQGRHFFFFSIDGGVPGFSLSAEGLLSTAAAPDAGLFKFSIDVQDEGSPRGQATTPFELEVRPLLRVANGVLVEGRQGQSYSQQLSATGGTPPYIWVVDGGAAPAGTSLIGSGLLQGNPSTVSNVSFGVTVADSANPPQSASRVVSVDTKTNLNLTFVIGTRAAADGRVGTAYSQPLKSFGGTGSVTWSIPSSSLPPGLMLTNSGSDWQVVGTPTASGIFNFTLRVEDALLASDELAMSIMVY